MTWHEHLGLEVREELRALAGPTWETIENAIWQYELGARETRRTWYADKYSRRPERRERARRHREWRQNARGRIVAVRCCPRCRKFFAVTALARAEGKDNACRGKCRFLLNWPERLVRFGLVNDTLAGWARANGLTEAAVYYRIKKLGWSPHKACTTPAAPPAARRWTKDVVTKASRAREAGISVSTLKSRLKAGMSMEQALATRERLKPPRPTGTLVARAEAAGIPVATVYQRVSDGWSVEAALATPPTPRGQRRWAPDNDSLKAKARAAGLPYNAVYSRVRVRGWSVERALATPVTSSRTATTGHEARAQEVSS